MIDAIKLAIQFLENMFESLWHVVEIVNTAWNVFTGRLVQFIPDFVLPFLILSVLITFVLFMFRRANK